MKQIFILKEANNTIHFPADLFKNIEKIDIAYRKENVVLFCLNTENKVVYSEIVHMGGLNACVIDPKTIFRIALLKNANSIIIAHNHPSGGLTPSREDEKIFRRLREAGDIITIECLDSIIFNKKEFYSMKGEVLK